MNNATIEIEGRMRRGWLAKAVFYALLPFAWLGLIDGCSAMHASISCLRFEWREKGARRWKSTELDYNVICDGDDGGHPVWDGVPA